MDNIKKQAIKSIIVASSGNLVEWFDFYIFAFTAVYFASDFFPKSNPTVQLLNVAGIYAVGFFMRPIGSWFFGRLADRHGRRRALIVSVTMMCAGSLMVAIVPTYSSVGYFAPILLLMARLIQGFSVGGEYGATATYMSEVALSHQRGFLSSFQYVTLIGGQLLAVLTIVILEMIFTDVQLKTWAWRIPFIIGALTAIASLKLRKSMTETLTHESRTHPHAGSIHALFRYHKKAFMVVFGFTAGGSLSFYTFTTYMHKFLVNTSHLPIKTASHVMTATLFVYMLIQPVFGALSDRIGTRKSMMLFSGLGALLTYPIMTLLVHVSDPLSAFILITCAMVIISFYTSIAGVVKAQLFPIELRALGVGLSYAVANSVFGGTAEFIALYLKNINLQSYFYIYVTVILFISFLISTISLPKLNLYLSNKDES
ncbi:MFS transporter [Ferrovum sp. PN-J185]|uniref:MFS family transporter n=1 Tax=Ferrovum sp. PN-J185 TaxID=1356306 RepID=UPI000794E317|nr:MFS family transporter [Ferrovum sp. PN-J185]KXW56637.1 alpha-ketoglutarate permease [Ferrovum sp. PN-J185]MCC6067677.1 MFS transporter [Ferrovum sp. PN-J185]